MDYAYFKENIGEEHIDNTGLFRAIREFYIDENEIYSDIDGGSNQELNVLLENLDFRDRLIVRSVVDLSDTAKQLLKVLSELQDKEVDLYSIEEPYLNGTDYYTALKGYVGITRHYAEKQRQQGYQQAKEEGRVGRPRLTKEVEQAVKLYRTKAFTIAEIEDMTKISKSTLYRYLKDVDRDA